MPATQPEVASGTTFERGPFCTWAACGICIVVFLGLARETNPSWRILSQYGYLSPWQIWDGQPWGLVTSVFVHREFLHLAFNVYWLWVLGSVLELALGSMRWMAFCLMAALVSSGAQFAVSESTGFGASGLVYAVFGFLWVGRDRFPIVRRTVTPQLVTLFLGWLVVCLLATLLNLMAIGNGAHFAGLAFGAAVAGLFLRRWRVPLVSAGLIALLAVALVPVFWRPWSPLWLRHHGYAAHVRHDYPAAVQYYEQSIQRGGDPVWALRNMAIAYAALRDQAQYTETLARLRQLDEDAAREVAADAGHPDRR